MNSVAGRACRKVVVLVDLRERQLRNDQLALDASDLFQAAALCAVSLVCDGLAMHKQILDPEGEALAGLLFWGGEICEHRKD